MNPAFYRAKNPGFDTSLQAVWICATSEEAVRFAQFCRWEGVVVLPHIPGKVPACTRPKVVGISWDRGGVSDTGLDDLWADFQRLLFWEREDPAWYWALSLPEEARCAVRLRLKAGETTSGDEPEP